MKHIRQAHHGRTVLQPFEVELLPPRVLDSVLEPGFHYKHYARRPELSDLLSSLTFSGMRTIGLLSLDPLGQLSARSAAASVRTLQTSAQFLPREQAIYLLDELISAEALLHEDLLAYWLASCSYDAIVIDASDELLQADWFGMIESAFLESGCSKRIPIIFAYISQNS